MTEAELLLKMVPPGAKRPGKWRDGVIQIHVTRSCDRACYGCTQGSQLGGKATFITPDQFRTACRSLRGYFGVVGMFGGNPAIHPQFDELCAVMREEVPPAQRGLWCNNPLSESRARIMRNTFNPQYSNLNVHMDAEAYRLFKAGWPECHPVGLDKDSRHSPCYVALKDVMAHEGDRNALISTCDINRHWSAMIGVFRGELRAWFCEIAGAQSILHQDESDYPDTGDSLTCPRCERLYGEDTPAGEAVCGMCTGTVPWWQKWMPAYAGQVRKHCHECSVPLRGYGELALSPEMPPHREQTSVTHAAVFKPKRKGRAVELVTTIDQLRPQALQTMTHYIQNAAK